MSQAGGFNGGGGGSGGTDIRTITTDDGDAVPPNAAHNINVLGQQAGTISVVDTTGNIGTNTVRVEDRTWITQYVVDPSATVGLRGTFTTIQSAVTAAFADGNTYATNIATIIVRKGSYVENITIPVNAAVNIKGLSVCGENGNQNGVFVNGTITISSNASVILENLIIYPISSDAVVIPTTYNTSIINCLIFGVTRFTGQMQQFEAQNTQFFSYVQADNTATATDFSNCATFFSCLLLGGSNLSGSAKCAWYSSRVVSFVLSGTSAVAYYNCKLLGTITGASTGTCEIYNSIYSVNSSGVPFANFSGTLKFGNVTSENGSGIYSSAQAKTYEPSSQGSIASSVKTAISYNVLFSDYYIGVTNTSSARTITLPDPATIAIDQMFIVKDESGACGANNITVATAAGNIDGAATMVLNVNYESFSFKSDGANYFIL